MILTGDLDYTINHYGMNALVKELEWDGKEQVISQLEGEQPLYWFQNKTMDMHRKDVWRSLENHPSVQRNIGKPKDKTIDLGGEFIHQDKLTYMRVLRTGLRMIDEKPDLMYYLLDEWMRSEEGDLKGEPVEFE